MVTREEALRRLEWLAKEIQDLSREIEQGWQETRTDDTHAFLSKCGGWEDDRATDETIREVYAARTASDRGSAAFA